MSTKSGSTATSSKRRYEKRRRAEAEQETRRRITAAAVELHGTLGPARTTVRALAELAGVQRATVYRHFPDEATLFQACAAHWAAENPPPDLSAFAAIDDPCERQRTALETLYGYYRGTERMLANIARDVPRMPALAPTTAPWLQYLAALEDMLASGCGRGDAGGRRAAIALALSLETWRLLTGPRGLSDARAAELMVRAIGCAGDPVDPQA